MELVEFWCLAKVDLLVTFKEKKIGGSKNLIPRIKIRTLMSGSRGPICPLSTLFLISQILHIWAGKAVEVFCCVDIFAEYQQQMAKINLFLET